MTHPETRLAFARRIIAAAFVAMPALLILATWMIWQENLPATLPTQWSGDEVVSRQPTVVFAIIAGTVALAAAAFVIHATWSASDYDNPRRSYLIAGSVAGVAAAGWLISASLAQTASTGDESPIGSLGLVAIGSIAYGLLPFAIAPRNERVDSNDNTSSTLRMAQTEALSWSHSINAPLFFLFGGAFAVASILLGWVPIAQSNASGAQIFGTAALSLGAVGMLAFARMRVTVDRRGLRVTTALLGLPLRRLPLSRVVAARADNISAGSWGGWGYRWRPGGSAVIVRSGPGLVVTLTQDRSFTVTVEDAPTAAASLNALSAQDRDGAAQERE